MSKLVSETEIPLDDPEFVVSAVCEHLVEHGATVGRDGAAWTLTWPQGRARLDPRGGGLHVRAETADMESLYLLRFGIASHVVEFSGDEALQIRWSGDGGDMTTPPNYRVASVVSAEDVTPHMRRVTLTGEGIERFMTDEALHLKLLMPSRPGAPIQAPTVGPDGLIRWPQGDDAPLRRTYTIRRFDRAAGTIDIDFVLHDDPGPGARWAVATTPGDVIGLMGPGGGGVPTAERILLAGDETALPAISRILESSPRNTRGVAILEVAGASERQPIRKPDGVELVWLFRDEGAPSLREEVLKRVPLGEADAAFYWAACEFETFKSIRGVVRKELKVPKERHLVASYWRRGTSGDAADRE
ncbi:DUF2218 domain-containing protein [Methylopila henanensis]|uniref:DUF2218 domain-containing protein n=1 Tax=Methylopila henanensis TaxID=873516 RepID=A0ABW4K8F0_9HYPH